jgi:hypothetical protein
VSSTGYIYRTLLHRNAGAMSEKELNKKEKKFLTGNMEGNLSGNPG